MRRRSKPGREPVKARRRKTVTLKRRNAPKAARRRSSSAATHETEVARLTRELKEALEQKTATSEVLRVISSSPGELEPVFQAMLEKATRLCEAPFGGLFLRDAGLLRLVASHVPPSAPAAIFQPGSQLAVSDNAIHPLVRMIDSKAVAHIADMRTDQSYVGRNPRIVAFVETVGAGTVLCVPMLKDNEYIGAFIIFRQEVRPFTDRQIELVQDFAAQAVIAIENARMFNELRQSLQQQTATADVLKVISRSTFDLQIVLNTLVESAMHLCRADNVVIFLRDGDTYRLTANYGYSREYEAFMRRHPITPGRGTIAGRTALECRPVHVSDIRADPDYTMVDAQRLGGFRTMLGVPLMRGGMPIGVMTLLRNTVQPFSEAEIDLAATFADQAVIAIANVRLFEAEQQRTRELAQSLEQQTATSEVLTVISRSAFDVRTVLNTLTESAVRLCAADMGLIFQQDGDVFRLVANFGVSGEAERYWLEHPVSIDRGSTTGRALLEGRAIHIPDVLADPEYRTTRHQELAGYRTTLSVPLLRDGTTIGVFGLSRAEVNPFTDKQIELLTTFANQAVIAIENARLLSELRERTNDLSESLEQQTATSEVLQVISSSPGDVRPVFQAMLENAVRICDATFGNIYRWDGNALHLASSHNTPPAYAEYRKRVPMQFDQMPESMRQMIETRSPVQTQPLAEPNNTITRAGIELGGIRIALGVPMLKEDIRKETDSLGEVDVPADKLLGARHQRSLGTLQHWQGPNPARDD